MSTKSPEPRGSGPLAALAALATVLQTQHKWRRNRARESQRRRRRHEQDGRDLPWEDSWKRADVAPFSGDGARSGPDLLIVRVCTHKSRLSGNHWLMSASSRKRP